MWLRRFEGGVGAFGGAGGVGGGDAVVIFGVRASPEAIAASTATGLDPTEPEPLVCTDGAVILSVVKKMSGPSKVPRLGRFCSAWESAELIPERHI
jgi:hypothetical protein